MLGGKYQVKYFLQKYPWTYRITLDSLHCLVQELESTVDWLPHLLVNKQGEERGKKRSSIILKTYNFIAYYPFHLVARGGSYITQTLKHVRLKCSDKLHVLPDGHFNTTGALPYWNRRFFVVRVLGRRARILHGQIDRLGLHTIRSYKINTF